MPTNWWISSTSQDKLTCQISWKSKKNRHTSVCDAPDDLLLIKCETGKHETGNQVSLA